MGVLVRVSVLAVLMLSACASEKKDAPSFKSAVDNTSKVAPSEAAPPDGQTGATVVHHASPIPDLSGLDAVADPVVAELLRYQHRDISKQQKKPVFIVASDSSEKASIALMKKLSPQVTRETRVLIKPNLGGFTWFGQGDDNGVSGRTTDPAFVEGIIIYLRSVGVTDIVIAEGWGVESPADVQRLFKVSGMQALVERYPGTRLLDLNYYGGTGPEDTQTVPVKVPIPSAVQLKNELYLPRIYIDYLLHGLVIYAPLLKTHRLAAVSAGVKNMMGVLGMEGASTPHRNKSGMHRELTATMLSKVKSGTPLSRDQFEEVSRAFAVRLADVYTVAKPHMTLIDGTLALEGDGFDNVRSVPLGAAIGSYNTAYADAVASQLVGAASNETLKKFTGYTLPAAVAEVISRHYPGLTLNTIKVSDPHDLLAGHIQLRIDSLGGVVPGNVESVMPIVEPMPVPRITADVSKLEELLSSWRFSESAWISRDWKGEALPPGVSTLVSVARTQTHLLVFFLARYRQLNPHRSPIKSGEIPDLYNYDVVEVFLDPDPATPETYLEFELDPLGRTLDLQIDRGAGIFDASFDSNLTTAVLLDREGHSWRAVMAIPFGPDFLAPSGNTQWKGNFFRIEGHDKEKLYMALRPTGTAKPSFHVPDAFGTLLFAGEN